MIYQLALKTIKIGFIVETNPSILAVFKIPKIPVIFCWYLHT
jgi:hypothetical protein